MKVKSELYLLTFITFASFLLIITVLRIALSHVEEYRERERYAYNISLSITRLNHQLRKVVKYRETRDVEVWYEGQQKLTALINTAPALSAKQKYLLHGISENNFSVIALFSLLQSRTEFPIGEVTSPAALHLIDRLYAQTESIREDSHLLSYNASNDMNELISRRIYMVSFLLVGLGALVVSTSIHLSRKITRSLATINSGLQKVSSGDFEEKLPQFNTDEFGEVASHFNSMTEELKFKTISMDRLQALVDERTDELRTLSETDPLTNVPNRRSYKRRLSDELASAKRNKSPLSLLMVDVDYFKQYNDNYGHDAGDIALQKVASCITESLPRETDFVARFGGEEFVVLLPATDATGACHIADRLLDRIRQAGISHNYADAERILTISIGIASCECGDQGDVDLLNQADQALYQAKENGRNQSQIYTA